MGLDLSGLRPGLTGSASKSVAPALTARAVGSGSLDVLATPMMIALMEQAAVDCIAHALPDGATSLGTHLDVSHDAASAIGITVTASAKLVAVDGRALTFEVEAHDGTDRIGRGRHTRVVVDSARFLEKLESRGAPAR